MADVTDKTEKEHIWYRQLVCRNLLKDQLVDGFDYSCKKKASFCESCVEGKHYRSIFSVSEMRAKEPLDLIHSDVCGKINEKSLSRAEYFVTFIDNKTRYVWVYVLKQKTKNSHDSWKGSRWWKD